MDIVLGLMLLALGLTVAFFGLEAWFFTLPIWGFIIGFALGAQIIHEWLGDGFLSTTGGIVAGILLGILFAVLSFAFWYIGALLVAASVGAVLANGLMSLFNVNTDWVIAVAAIIGAILFGILAAFLNLPVYMVIVSSAFAGAAAAIAGVLLLFNQLNSEDLGNGYAYGVIEDNWYWSLPYIVIGILGILLQMSRRTRTTLPEEKWVRAQYA